MSLIIPISKFIIMQQFINLLNQMSPYLLLGFLFAGILHAFIPSSVYKRYLANNNFRSVIYATLLGIPLPLCSCGVIPTAMSLRKEGASKGATVAFLIATPQTGLDSIFATYGLMGLPFAIVRPIAALITALLGGGIALLGIKKDPKKQNTSYYDTPPCQTILKTSFTQKCIKAFKYGYITMMQDIGKWLIIGLLAAAIITLGIPEEWFAIFKGNTLASMLLVLCIAIPMYVCATGSIPIAVALMMKGLTPGAALVLLMAGPACNIASILVVRKVLGKHTLALYILAIVIGSILFGAGIDYLQFSNTIDFISNLTIGRQCHTHNTSWTTWACTILLITLLINAMILKQRHHKQHNTNIIKHKNMKTFKIEGMSCNHCRTSAEKAILEVSGVTAANVDLQKKEAYVEGTATAEDICQAIEAIGFSCIAL